MTILVIKLIMTPSFPLPPSMMMMIIIIIIIMMVMMMMMIMMMIVVVMIVSLSVLGKTKDQQTAL